MSKLSRESICVKSGEYPNQSHILPIVASSTFVFDSVEHGMDIFTGKEAGYVYSRWENPTVDEVASKIAALEGFGLNLPLKAYMCSSGMGAISTLMLGLLTPGDKILSHYSLYGGTEELLSRILAPLHIETIVVDFSNLNALEDCLKADAKIKLIHIETPANPTLKCADIQAICALAAKYQVKVSADNTFATPILQQPFKWGVDFVVHSTTKYLNGHGTAIGGILIGKDIELMNTRIKKTFRLIGANYNPFEAWLVMNGLKTLPLRMKQHCLNAKEVAQFLKSHPAVEHVNYLSFPEHPDHLIAAKQMTDFGGMISFELKGGLEAGKSFINKLQLCVRAVSLGTCDTLISHPASMTHFGVPREERLKYHITDGLIRMSVGIEAAQDIIADLEQAMNTN